MRLKGNIVANLIIDIGNTAVKAAWTVSTTLGKIFRYQGERVSDFILSLTAREKPEVMVISSVYAISDADGEVYRRECGRLWILDGKHTGLLAELGLPAHLTYDRAAAILAAKYLFKGKACLLFDFGNTLSVDCIHADGSYGGGNISLGCRTRFKALNRYSKALPLVAVPESTDLIGHDFKTSITAGVIAGINFEIDGYLRLYPDWTVLFTGGDAIYFAKRMKKSIFVIYNLVLMGLALIADGNVKEKF